MSHEIRTPMNAILGYAQQLGIAEDRVHRRADLVGHVRQAGALRPARAFRSLLGSEQLGRAAGDQRFEMLLVITEFADKLLAFSFCAEQIRHVSIDANHSHGAAVRVANGLADAANGADDAVGSSYPEVGPVLASTAQRGLDVGVGLCIVFGHEAPVPRIERAAELFLDNTVQPVHRVVPHQPISLHGPVPDAKSRCIDRDL